MSRQKEIEKKCGRLIIGRLPGLDVPGEYLKELKNGGLGGITLFRENCSEVEQLSALIGTIYESSFHFPVVTADQEGGAVQRFCPSISSIPSAMVFAACPDRPLVHNVLSNACNQLKLLGLNILFAPVLDVLTRPENPVVSTRSFGSKPGIVERNAQEMIEIITQAGLIPVGKHFPGHGATSEDSHHTLAVSDVDSDRLWNVDLAPFKNCLSELPAIMTGHIWVKCVDEEPVPASLSPRVTTAILKDYLKFDGLVMTDDMTMKGLTESNDLADAAVKAVLAGNDLLIVCGQFEESLSCKEGLIKAVVDGVIEEERIDEAITKLDKLLVEKPDIENLPYKSKRAMKQLKENIETTNQMSREVAKLTSTLLKGDCPEIKDKQWTVLVPDHSRYSLDLVKHLQSASGSKYGEPLKLEEIRYPVNPNFEESQSISKKCTGKNCIYVTFRCLLNEGQLQLGQMVADECVKSEKIAIVSDTPFDFDGLPDWPSIIATYDPSDRAIEALAECLVDSQVSSKGAFYFARLIEGVSMINRKKVIQ